MGGDGERRCIFCAVGRGEIVAFTVFEDDAVIAFADRHPVRPGHMLILPRRHFDYFDHLPPELAARILHVGQHIARAQKESYDVERSAFFFSGGDVAHVHAHVYPIHESSDITSRRYIAEETVTFRPMPRESDAALQDAVARIRTVLAI